MAVARFVNWPDTLAELVERTLDDRLIRSGTTFGPAYKIMPTGERGSKAKSVGNLLDHLWTGRTILRPQPGDTLAVACEARGAARTW